jgi:hypothetical protein
MGNAKKPFSLEEKKEDLGRLVRKTWIDWARRQHNCKESWLLSYDELPLAEREIDNEIGYTLALRGARLFVDHINSIRQT